MEENKHIVKQLGEVLDDRLEKFRERLVGDIGEVIEQNITPQLDTINTKLDGLERNHGRRLDRIEAGVADLRVSQRRLVSTLNKKRILTDEEAQELALHEPAPRAA